MRQILTDGVVFLDVLIPGPAPIWALPEFLAPVLLVLACDLLLSFLPKTLLPWAEVSRPSGHVVRLREPPVAE